jgi:chorismate synthase
MTGYVVKMKKKKKENNVDSQEFMKTNPHVYALMAKAHQEFVTKIDEIFRENTKIQAEVNVSLRLFS